MNAGKNHFVLDFDGKLLTIRINGKLVVAYPRRDLRKTVLDSLFLSAAVLITGPPPPIKESFEDLIPNFQIPSVGPCAICGRNANLLGGICYTCHSEG